MESQVKVGDLVNDTWEKDGSVYYIVLEKLIPHPKGEVDWAPKHGKVIVADSSTGKMMVKWEAGLTVLSSSAQ